MTKLGIFHFRFFEAQKATNKHPQDTNSRCSIKPQRVMDDATWKKLLETCAKQLGDELSEAPESWELCVLAKVAAKTLGLPKRSGPIRSDDLICCLVL